MTRSSSDFPELCKGALEKIFEDHASNLDELTDGDRAKVRAELDKLKDFSITAKIVEYLDGLAKPPQLDEAEIEALVVEISDEPSDSERKVKLEKLGTDLESTTLDLTDLRVKDEPVLCYLAPLEGTRVLMELLIEAGADIEAKGKEEMTPLHLAVLGRRVETVKMLLEKDASLEARTGGASKVEKQRTVFHLAVVAPRGSETDTKEQRVAVLSVLLDALEMETGPVLGWASEDGSTPLHVVRDEECGVKLLKDHGTWGVAVDPRDAANETPLHTAAMMERAEIVTLLCDKYKEQGIKLEFDLKDSLEGYADDSGDPVIIDAVKKLLNPGDD